MKFILSQIENALNSALNVVIWIIKKIISIIPVSIKDFFKLQWAKIIEIKSTLVKKCQIIYQQGIKLIIKMLKGVIPLCKRIWQIIITVIKKIISFDIRKVSIKSIFLPIFLVIYETTSSALIKFRDWILGLQPFGIFFFFTTVTIIVLALVKIFISSETIYKNAIKKRRDPASMRQVVYKKAVRPTYYKREDKVFDVGRVLIPVYVASSNSVRSLAISFQVVSSNRYIVNFFYDNTHYISDCLNTSVEPIIPTFPLTNEGKEILRNKVKKEMNNLIEKLHIKGKIEQVYITEVMAM